VEPPAVEVRGLEKRYGGRAAVDGVSFAVRRGEAFGILGPNGAGKTTTLEVVEGLRRPDAGTAEVLGEPVWPRPERIQRRIGVQLQSTALFDRLTAGELAELFARFYLRPDAAERARAALALVGLDGRVDAYPAELSGGQRQRLAIALALVHDPEVVFLDEPTTGLDPQARRNLWDVIRDVRAGGKTLVVTTHYLEEAEALCDRVAIMDGGSVIALDTPAALVASLRADARLSFRAAALDGLDVAALPGVTGATRADDRHLLLSADVQASVLGLLTEAKRRGVRIEDLSVRGPTLEDVFLHLTGREFRE
jgi:ABC-2 type transport system ATP-binding protein